MMALSQRKRKLIVVVGADRNNSFCYRVVDRLKFFKRIMYMRMWQTLIVSKKKQIKKRMSYELIKIGVDSQ